MTTNSVGDVNIVNAGKRLYLSKVNDLTMNRATVEQVLADFESLSQRYESLSDEEKKQVEVKTSERGMLVRVVSKAEPKSSRDSTRLNRGESSRFGKSGLPPDTISNTSFKSQAVKKSGTSISSYKVLLDEELIEFTKGYLETYTQLWWLEALVGSQTVMQHLKLTKRVDDRFVEELIEKYRGLYYLDEPQEFLFSTTSELLESDFGRLSSIKPIEALKRFGLEKMEESKEKVFVKLQ